MNKIIKLTILSVILNFNILYGANFNSYFSNNWEWISLILLIVLFAIILVSIVKEIKNNREKIERYISQEKCKNIQNYNYLNNINNERINASKKIKSTLKTSKKDSAILKELEKVYKDIFLTNKEESIFLNVATEQPIGKIETFKLDSLMQELEELDIANEYSFGSGHYEIVANKEIIISIFILLNKLQTKENNNIMLNTSIHENYLRVKINRDLKLNSEIKKVFKNNIVPIYSKKDNRYYGVYLYLIKHLSNRINAIVKINIEEDSYNVSVDIPIDIKYNKINLNKPKIVLKDPKKSLIIGDQKITSVVSDYLKKMNFIIKTENIKEINKELPNFIEYDIAFIYSKVFEPILNDYLKTIKSYSNLKIVALVDDSSNLYPSNIVDEVINIDNLEKDINSIVKSMFKRELSQKTDKISISKKEKDIEGKVLIADDDITNLHILEYMLKQYNLEVVAKTNGEDILKAIEKDNFDLIILDSIMPKLSGYETISKIRENPKFNATPIVIHSSFSLEDGGMDKIFKLGFDSFLPKPFNKDDLKSLIERYIPSFSKINIDKKPNINTKQNNNETLKEFIAIYSDSDKMLDRYIKEKRYEQAFSLISDLKNVAKDISANNFLDTLSFIENSIKNKKNIDSDILYKLSNDLEELKTNILKKISA